MCTLKHTGSGTQELKENSVGLSLGCLSVPEIPPALKLLLLCSLLASDGCVKSGGGVFGTVCLEAEAKQWWWWRGGGGGGRLMNRRTGLLLGSSHCWSFPSCFACPLTELFMASSLAPDLSHTCQQQQVFFRGGGTSLSPFSLLLQLHIKQRGKVL